MKKASGDGEKSFVEALRDGDADYEDVDDYIHAWHESDSALTLHEYLGMTWREFCVFAKEHTAGLKRLFRRGCKKGKGGE